MIVLKKKKKLYHARTRFQLCSTQQKKTNKKDLDNIERQKEREREIKRSRDYYSPTILFSENRISTHTHTHKLTFARASTNYCVFDNNKIK